MTPDIVNSYILNFGLNNQATALMQSTYVSLTNASKREDKFMVTNELSRQRFKTTALILMAFETGCDIVIPYQNMKKYVKQDILRIQKKLNIETEVNVYTMREIQGTEQTRELLVDELPKGSHVLLKELLPRIKTGFVAQHVYKELVFEGLL